MWACVHLQTDVSLSGYKAHLVSQSAAAPLTFAEEELKLVKETETNHHINIDTKHQTVQGINFPLSQEALDRINDIKDKTINYVQLVSESFCSHCRISSVLCLNSFIQCYH